MKSENYQELLKLIIEHKEFIELEEELNSQNKDDLSSRSKGKDNNAAEDALEAIALFNDNMKQLAVNAY